MKRGKKYLEAAKLVDPDKKYDAAEAFALVKKTSITKFDASIDIAFRLNLEPRKAEQNLRGAIVLPAGTGKVNRVVVVATGEKAKEAQTAGADFVGSDDFIEKVQKGWFEFDVVIATPDMMAKLAKVGRLLGTKGLMPNPKTGTVTLDVAKAVHEAKNGKVEYRVDKVGNIHLLIGKSSFKPEQLLENAKTIYQQLARIKPVTVKGAYFKNVTISASMGPGIRIDETTLA